LSVLPKESPKLLRDVAFVLPRRVVTTDLSLARAVHLPLIWRQSRIMASELIASNR